MRRVGVAVAAMRRGRWHELRDIAAAQLELLRAEAMRRARPLGEFVEPAISVETAPTHPSSAELQICERVESAINRAARYGVFRPLCLTRAVALSHMLSTHGISGHQIQIGVRRDGDSFAAHAWVEWGPRIVGDTEANALSYVPLAHLSVVSDRVFGGRSGQGVHRGAPIGHSALRWNQ